MIVCLEGIDGCGKTTQARLLTERFGARAMKYPDRSTPIGKLIYEHLEQKWSTYWRQDRDQAANTVLDATVFQALHLMDQSARGAELEAAADLGDVVLDRYWPSGYAYGVAEGLDAEWMTELYRRWFPQPDVFILLAVDVATACARMADKVPDRYEARSDFMAHVAQNYVDLWRLGITSGHPWLVVDASGPVEQVAEELAGLCGELRESLSHQEVPPKSRRT